MEGKWCRALLFADDVVMMAESEELQRMIDIAGEYGRRWRCRGVA